jgi:hypothetical protein
MGAAEPREPDRGRWQLEALLALGFVLLLAAAAYGVAVPALSDTPDTELSTAGGDAGAP